MNNIDAIADDHEKIPVVPDPQSDRMAGEPGRDDADEAAFDEVWTNCLDSIRKENYQAAATFLGAAFWLDVDGYATPQEALGALRGFCAVTGLPKPSPVISSGPVIHVYWLMSEFVPRERRLEAARMLKALTTAHKLLVACTEDIETVLRPVGTRNFKNPAMPQTVATLHPRDGAPPRRFDLAKFEVLLGAAVHALPQAVRTASSATSGPRPSQTLAGEITGQFDWVDYTEAVAADIFGACNETMSRPPEDVRFGNKGSVSVNVTTGIWYDHENERGGGIKEHLRPHPVDVAPRAVELVDRRQRGRHAAGPGKEAPARHSGARRVALRDPVDPALGFPVAPAFERRQVLSVGNRVEREREELVVHFSSSGAGLVRSCLSIVNATKPTHISSVVCSPQRTFFGGFDGLLGFLAELS